MQVTLIVFVAVCCAFAAGTSVPIPTLPPGCEEMFMGNAPDPLPTDCPCFHEGELIPSGTDIPTGDCNTCTCYNGGVACTMMGCNVVLDDAVQIPGVPV